MTHVRGRARLRLPDGDELKAKLNDTTRAQLLQAMPGLKERAKTLIELIDSAYFIFADRPLELEPKAAALLTPENRKLIGQLRAALEKVDAVERGDHGSRACAPLPKQNSLKLGAVAQPLRVALTGRTTSPGIFRRSGRAGTRGMPGPAWQIKATDQANDASRPCVRRILQRTQQ